MIIGAWLLGYHTEDLAVLEPSDFSQLGPVVNAIKHVGRNTFELSRAMNLPITFFVEMTSLYQEFLYQQAIVQIAEAKAKTYLANLKPNTPAADIAKHLEAIAGLQNVTNLSVPEENIALRYAEELDKRSQRTSISWGMKDIDWLMGGMRTTELTTVAGRPGTGKSALLLQIGLSIARQQKKVLYFPLEMSTTQTVERIILRTTDVSYRSLREGTLTRAEWEQLNIALDKVNNLEQKGDFMIFEGNNNLTEIKNLVSRYKPYAIIVDQLTQLRDNKSFKSLREQFSYMTNELKRLAMAEDIQVLLAAQINRNAQDSEPTMANLKESGSIEEDSDNVILLHRIPASKMEVPEEWDDNIRPMLIKIEKQRSGSVGTIQAKFLANKFRFEHI